MHLSYKAILHTGAHGASATPSSLQDPANPIEHRQGPQKLVERHSVGFTSLEIREHEKNQNKIN